MLKYTVLFALIASFAVTSALSPEEEAAFMAAAIPHLHACAEEFGIVKEDILVAVENKNIDALNPCIYFCLAKKAGLMNEDGLFNVEVAQQKGKELIKNEKSLETANSIIKTCAAVNDQTVADGCERSKLLLGCIIKERSSRV